MFPEEIDPPLLPSLFLSPSLLVLAVRLDLKIENYQTTDISYAKRNKQLFCVCVCVFSLATETEIAFTDRH